MSHPRIYLAPEKWKVSDLSIEGDEAHHCATVLRCGPGGMIQLFDGLGRSARCRITTAGRGRLSLIVEEESRTPAPAVSISLIQAIPKGANMEWILEKAVELGVNEVFPVITERTVVRLDAREAAKKREKWQRVAVGACKQCGQNWLPQVHAPAPFASVLESLPAQDLKIIAALQPDSKSLKSIISDYQPSTINYRLFVAIGPEGDFTPAEYAAARAHGFVPVTLGPLVLRVETAALYALSAISHELRG